MIGLKYFDLANCLGAGVVCPYCKKRRCRPSRWRSKQEKANYRQVSRPYRCDECGHRFLTPKSALFTRDLINYTAAAALVLGALIVPAVWLGGGTEMMLEELVVVTGEIDQDDILAARRGDSEAQRKVGEALLKGSVGGGGYALSWLQKSADGGNTGAMVLLGRALQRGEKGPKDVGQAVKWMQRAAAAGDAEGMLELGRIYRDGSGLERDAVRAYVWLSRAAGRNSDAIRERDELVRQLSPERLKEAQDQAAEAVNAGISMGHI